jgi:hypothetical protein
LHGATAEILANVASPMVHQALKPLWMELQGLEGMVLQACAATFENASRQTPALQMFTKDRMCFIPYCANDPHCDSKART